MFFSIPEHLKQAAVFMASALALFSGAQSGWETALEEHLSSVDWIVRKVLELLKRSCQIKARPPTTSKDLLLFLCRRF